MHVEKKEAVFNDGPVALFLLLFFLINFTLVMDLDVSRERVP